MNGSDFPSVESEFAARASSYHSLSTWVNDEKLAEIALAMVSRPDIVALMDAGGGTGALAAYFQRCSRVGRVVVVDASQEMLAEVPDNIETVNARLEALPNDLGIFDVILLRQVLHYCENVGSVLASVSRHLAPNGVIYLAQVSSLSRAAAKWLEPSLAWSRNARRHMFSFEDLVGRISDAGFVLLSARLDAFDVSLVDAMRRSSGVGEADVVRLVRESASSAPSELNVQLISDDVVFRRYWTHLLLARVDVAS